MKVLKECIVCRSGRIRPLSDYSKLYLHQCESCSMVFSNEVPEGDKLQNHYEQYRRDDYHSPITVKRYRELLDTFEVLRKTNRILDIGCGIGYFLEEAKNRNWETFGTEYTEMAVEICRKKGFTIYSGDLLDLNLDKGSFDVVVSIEVLEHLSDPIPHVRKIRELLRPGGGFYLTTPNIRSLNSRILGNKWNVMSYPEHLCYYSKRTLHELLSSNSFEKVYIKSNGISPERLFSSIQGKKVDYSSPETRDEQLRRTIEKYRLLKGGKSLLNLILNRLSIGENLKAYYTKS